MASVWAKNAAVYTAFEMLIARAKDLCIIKRVYFVDVLVYLFDRFLFLLASLFCLEEL